MSQKNKIKKRKSVAFPMMGNVYIPVKTILKKLGAKVVLPPENNKTTLDLGVKNSIEASVSLTNSTSETTSKR